MWFFSKKGIKDRDSKVFQNLLYKVEIRRTIRKKESEYEYERKKAEEFKGNTRRI